MPLADRTSLFNHAIGKQLQRVWHGETEGRGGLEIDNKLVSERELNRQITWARAPQYPINRTLPTAPARAD